MGETGVGTGIGISRSAAEPATYLDCSFYTTHALSPVVVHLFATFDRLDPGTLGRAHAALFDQVPVLGANLVGGRWVPARFDPAAQLAFLDLSHLGEAATAGLERLTRRFIRHDPAPGRAPQLKSVLIRLDGRDALAMQMQHTAMDGVGFRDVFYLLAENYSRLRRQAPLAVPRQLRPIDALVAIVRGLGADEVRTARNVQERDRRRLQTGGRVLQLEAEAAGVPGFLTLRLPPALLAGLKRRGEGLNDQLLATMALAMAQTPGAVDGPLARLGMPVNLRRYLDPDAAVYGNLSATSYIEFSVTAETPVEAVIAKTAAETAFVKRNVPGLAQLLSLPSLEPVPAVQNRQMGWVHRLGLALGMSGPVLTNVGSFDTARCAFDGVPPITVNGTSTIPRNGVGLIACATGYRGGITIQVPHTCSSEQGGTRRRFVQAWGGLLARRAGEDRSGSSLIASSVFG